MKLTIKIFGLLVFLTVEQIAFGQQDNYAKNTKLFEDEQARFESELKTNMDSAEVYWNHANIIAGFTFNVYKEAWQFYEVALSIDLSLIHI